MRKEQELVRKDGEANFYTLDEVIFHLKLAYSDLLGHYTYKGLKGMELIKETNSHVKEICNGVVEEILGKDYFGENQ